MNNLTSILITLMICITTIYSLNILKNIQKLKVEGNKDYIKRLIQLATDFIALNTTIKTTKSDED